MKNSYQRFINLRNSQKKNLVEETSKIELESLVKYFPLIGIFILLCSATELGFYYVYFSIDIFTFVETSEILTLYLGTVLILIIRLTIYITLGFYVVKLFVFGIDKIIGLFKKNKNRSGSKNRPTQIIIVIPALIYSVYVEYLIFNEYTRDYETLFILAKVILGILCLYICIAIGLLVEKQLTKIELSAFIFITGSMMITLMIFEGMSSAANIYENKESRSSFSFKYNNEVLKDDDSLIFVGNTNKFVFLYDIKTAKSKIYSMDKIENFELD